MSRVAVAVLAWGMTACGSRAAAPPPDFGPPAAPVDPPDPIACPAARLERFAAMAETTITISTEPVVDAGRIDKLPCKTDETDEQCLARARKRPDPSFYEVVGVKIGGDVTHVEFTYDLDGRRFTEQADSMQDMVARLKAFQAAGHKVVVIRGESAPDAGSRHAAITYRGIGGQQRRVAALTWRPTKQDTDRAEARQRAMARIQALAVDQRIELRSLEAADEDSLVITVTCGAGL